MQVINLSRIHKGFQKHHYNIGIVFVCRAGFFGSFLGFGDGRFRIILRTAHAAVNDAGGKSIYKSVVFITLRNIGKVAGQDIGVLRRLRCNREHQKTQPYQAGR